MSFKFRIINITFNYNEGHKISGKVEPYHGKGELSYELGGHEFLGEFDLDEYITLSTGVACEYNLRNKIFHIFGTEISIKIPSFWKPRLGDMFYYVKLN